MQRRLSCLSWNNDHLLIEKLNQMRNPRWFLSLKCIMMQCAEINSVPAPIYWLCWLNYTWRSKSKNGFRYFSVTRDKIEDARNAVNFSTSTSIYHNRNFFCRFHVLVSCWNLSHTSLNIRYGRIQSRAKTTFFVFHQGKIKLMCLILNWIWVKHFQAADEYEGHHSNPPTSFV